MTLKELTKIVLEIRDNHLEHMKQDMDKMDAKIDKMDNKVEKMDTRLWAILLVLISSVLGFILHNILTAGIQ